MVSKVKQLAAKQLLSAPGHVAEGVQYETIMGSFAYGCSSDTSDMDIYGFSIPGKEIVFPHLAGEILGFGKPKQRFECYQQHHVKDNAKEYDLNIFSIVKYFNLVLENNPNMIDSLFTPLRCITHITPIGQLVRDHRKDFLSKAVWHRFKGYSFQQLHKMRVKNPDPTSKRYESIMKYGFDVKFGYHVIRLLQEVEMILTEGDLDLERGREHLKAIRAGEVSMKEIEDYFKNKESSLETLYENSKLPWAPDEDKIKQLLLQCLTMHFGNLDKVIVTSDPVIEAVRNIESICQKLRGDGLV